VTSIIDAMSDPDAFAPWFQGDSWAAWRSILKAAFALPMTLQDVNSHRNGTPDLH